ncbi:hypothetical protein ACFWRZ_08105 [Streptomyces rubiginosohelvolus]|uniref:hypothetical protein n=1 Tax=Streptomyces rubiginosohelvolus TaxID=67362 RepID=UPI003665E54C
MNETVMAISAGLGGLGLGIAVLLFVFRNVPFGLRDKGPACDRCQKATHRPYLRWTPGTPWHCADCEKKVDALLFGCRTCTTKEASA